MEKYRVYLHLDLLDAMPARAYQRHQLMAFIRSLESAPFAAGDFTDKDSTLRVRQIKIVGDYAVTWWADHPAKAVMVVDIRKAD